ncbi:MAG: hypothetical protein IJF69_00635 [Clostridia bacterium]|nr:hypothetical protein [Clostridia bacterium]
MGSYIFTLTAAAVVSAVVAFLAPDGENGKIGKMVAFAGALVLMVVMLSPLPGVLGKDINIEGYQSADKSASGKSTAEYYANMAGELLCRIYGTRISDIKAEVYCSSEGDVDKIVLNLKEKKPAFSTDEAGEVLCEALGFEVEVKGSDAHGEEDHR